MLSESSCTYHRVIREFWEDQVTGRPSSKNGATELGSTKASAIDVGKLARLNLSKNPLTTFKPYLLRTGLCSSQN